ncbi:MAG: DUF1415 domain-containing protein [Pseudomonadota bacterium]
MSTPADDTLDWLQRIVVDLNLCPFAAPALRADAVDIVVSDAVGADALLRDTLHELNRLVAVPATQTDTVLIVFSHDLQQFDDYVQFAALVDDVIDALALRGVLQLATFHPHYQFEGAARADRDNFTNRAPWPTLHVLREASLAEAIDAHADTNAIPARNRQLLTAMSDAQFERLFGRRNPS